MGSAETGTQRDAAISQPDLTGISRSPSRDHGHRRRPILERRNVAVDDRLAPARGILVAIVAGTFVWTMIILSIWMLAR
jgi:hypothetical protein